MALRSKIRGKEQIQDNTIDNGRLEANFLDGSDLNLTDGNNNATLTGLAAGSAANDAVNKAQLDAVIAAITNAHLESVATISTGNETLSGVGQSINGHVVAVGDRIAPMFQTTATEDGIYVAAAGAWARSSDALAAADLGGKTFTVEAGTEAETLWIISNDSGSGIVGTDDLVPVKVAEAPASTPTEVWEEAPTITNGSAIVTLANTPIAGTQRVYLNGLRMFEGVSQDYTISGATITFGENLRTTPAPQADIVVADYQF